MLLAFAFMGDVHAGGGGFAFIAVGLAVATADRIPDVGAAEGLFRADAFAVAVAGMLGTVIGPGAVGVILAGARLDAFAFMSNVNAHGSGWMHSPL